MADDAATDARRRPRTPRSRAAPRKSMTIGAVCKALAQEFPDISISKIRYLEDQKLLDAAAHAGRLPALQRRRRRAPAHDPAPAARRVPAAARHPPGAGLRARRRGRRAPRGAPRATARAARRAARRRSACRDRGALYSLEDVLEETRAEPALVRELEEYGVIKGEQRAGVEVLRRDRARDRPRRHRAGALRRRRAQPARLPHLGRPRGGAAAADPRPGAALAQPRAPQGGGRGAREPRRGHDAPQAPAADPRPAQDRRAERVDLDARCVREIPDFPQPGIGFKDITPLLADAAGARRRRRRRWPSSARPLDVDFVVGAEARGFLLGPGARPRARRRLRPGPQARQAAPRRRCRPSTQLEYGTDTLEVHTDALRAGARVLVHDDLLATGGTARGAVRARRAARRRGRRLRVPGRAGVPAAAASALGAARRALAGALRGRVGADADDAPQPLVAAPARRGLATSSATRTTCRAGGRASSASRRSTATRFTEVLQTDAAGARCAPTSGCSSSERAQRAALRRRSSRARRSSACCRRRETEIALAARAATATRRRRRRCASGCAGSSRLGGFMVRRADAAHPRRGARRAGAARLARR